MLYLFIYFEPYYLEKPFFYFALLFLRSLYYLCRIFVHSAKPLALFKLYMSIWVVSCQLEARFKPIIPNNISGIFRQTNVVSSLNE